MLNGRVLCVEWEGPAFVAGKVYEFVNGRTTLADGFSSSTRYTNLEELNTRSKGVGKFEWAKVDSEMDINKIKSGDKLILRAGNRRYVLLETNSMHYENGNLIEPFMGYSYNDDLTHTIRKSKDIMEVYRGDKLILQRIEKSPKELEIERIEKEMRKLADDLEKVRAMK